MLHVACLICWAKTESMAQKVFCWIRQTMWTIWTNLSSRPIVLTTTKKSNISGKQLDFHEFIQPEKSYKKAIKKRIFTWTTGRTITTRWTVLAGCSCKPWLYTHTHTQWYDECLTDVCCCGVCWGHTWQVQFPFPPSPSEQIPLPLQGVSALSGQSGTQIRRSQLCVCFVVLGVGGGGGVFQSVSTF